MSIQDTSVKRPITILMLFFAGIIFGIISLNKMEMDILPPIQYPEISVITLYPGASPKEIETLISRPVEEAVNGVTGVKNVRSESIEGASLVVAKFEWSTDIDFATIKVREKVDMVKGILPQDAEKSIVTRFDPNAMPIVGISITGKLSNDKIREITKQKIKPKFERINGIANAKITGGRIREVQVLVDLSRLYAHELSIFDIVNRINMSNYNFPAGNVVKENKEFLIRTIGEFKELSDIENVLIQKDDNGKAIYVRDIATVSFSYKDQTSISFLNENESIGLSIIKEAGKNTVKISKKVHELVKGLNFTYKDQMNFHIHYDSSLYIKSSISNVSSSALLGGVIAFLVILLFLKNIKNAMIIATIIPTSILITLLLMYIKDITLNMMSLGGLALGIGMLVDNGIVVIESIQKKIDANHNYQEACSSGISDVKKPLLASTLTTIVVFLPIIFVTGIAGAFFTQLAFTVSVSLIVSYAVSISLVPSLFMLLTRDRNTNIFNSQKDIEQSSLIEKLYLLQQQATRPIKNLSESLDRKLTIIQKSYNTFISKKLTHFKKAAIGGIVSIVTGIIMISLFIDTGFLPETDNGSVIIRIAAPKGTPLLATKKITLKIDKFISTLPYVKNRIINIGYNPEEISEYFGREKDRSTAEIIVLLKQGRNFTVSVK